MATLAKSSDFDYSVEKGRKDAQRQNNSDRNVRQFRDLDLYFTKASGTKDVNKVTDVQAVKRSIRNLVLLNRFEKPFSRNEYEHHGKETLDRYFEFLV